MLEISHTRLQNRSSYIQHVYGETEVGGTAMLYIADLNLKTLGFPELNDIPLPSIDWPYMQAVPGVIAVMVTLSTAIYLRTHRSNNKHNPTAGEV